MEAGDLKPAPCRVLTCRDGHAVIAEDVETEVAGRMRFASAIDVGWSRDDPHAHRVELRAGDAVIDAWTGPERPSPT